QPVGEHDTGLVARNDPVGLPRVAGVRELGGRVEAAGVRSLVEAVPVSRREPRPAQDVDQGAPAFGQVPGQPQARREAVDNDDALAHAGTIPTSMLVTVPSSALA